MRNSGLAVGFFLLIGFSIQAQKQVTHQQVIWANYSVSWKVNDQWSLSSTGNERHFIRPHRKHMFLGTTTMMRSFPSGFMIGGHISYARFTLPHDPDIEQVVKRYEIRPNQSISFVHHLNSKWKLTYRFMMEERFLQPKNEDGSIRKGTFKYQANRYRLRILASYSLFEKSSINFSDEFMLQSSSTYPFDQNRSSIYLKTSVAKGLSLSVGYLNWYQRRQIVNSDLYFDRHSWLFTVYYSI